MSISYEAFLDFVQQAHAGQTDKGGKPYVDHLRRVAARTNTKFDTLPADMLGDNERHEILLAALGHDLFEDTNTSADDIRSLGGTELLIERIGKLSRMEPKPVYQDWIAALAEDDDIGVVLVKLADNEDNNDPARIAQLPPEQRSISKRYDRAHKTLSAGLERLLGTDNVNKRQPI